MNIFVVSTDITACAQILDDLRLNKMILETAQLLSTALHVHSSSYASLVYKKTHTNHPCAVWARTSRENYIWLLQYFEALILERNRRGFKQHKSAELYHHFNCGALDIPSGPMTPFMNCTPHKNTGTFDAYKLTLKDKWVNDKRPPRWTNTQKPSWA